MVYYYNTMYDGIGTVNVVVGVEFNSNLYTTVNLIYSAELLMDLKMHGIELSVLWPDEIETPVLIMKSAEKSARINSIYDYLLKAIAGDVSKLSDKKFLTSYQELIAKAISSTDFNPTVLFTATCRQALWEHKGEELSSMVVSDPSLIETSHASTVRKLNELHVYTSSAIGGIDPSDNITKYQDNCTDELFIHLPSSNELKLEDVDMDKFTPAKFEICKPFSDDVYYTPAVFDRINKGSNEYYRVVGKSDNNTYDLYANEEKYHKALSSWCANNLVPDVDGEGKGTLDAIAQEYLESLAARLYMYGWGHLVCMPVDISADENTSTNSLDSKYRFRLVEGQTDYSKNAIIELINFLEYLCVKQSYEVYADAIVQLARWGDRKQTQLVFKDTDNVFDLSEAKATKATLIQGSLEHTEIVPGYDYIISAYLSIYGKVVGVELQSQMKDAAGMVYDTYTEISLIDALRMTASGERIAQAECLSADHLLEDIEVIDIAAIKDMQNVHHHCSKALNDLRISTNFVKATDTQLTMMKTVVDNLDSQIDFASVKAYCPDDIIKVCNDLGRVNPKTVASFVFLHDWVDSLVEFKNASEIMPSFWAKVLEEKNPVEGFFKKEESRQVTEGAEGVSKLQSFGTAGAAGTVETVSEVKPEVSKPSGIDDGFSMYRPVTSSVVANVVYGENVICKVALDQLIHESNGVKKKNVIYTIMDPNSKAEATREVPLFKILATIVHQQYVMLDLGKAQLQQIYYENKEAFLNFRNKVKDQE